MQEPWRRRHAGLFSGSFTVQDHLPRHGAIHSGLCPPASLNNQENAPIEMPPGQSDRGEPPIEPLLITLGCIQLTAEANWAIEE